MESFNPQVLPSSLPRKEHHKATMIALWAGLGAIVVGLLYVWLISKQIIPTPISTAPEKVERSDFALIRTEIGQATPRQVSQEESSKLKKQGSSPPRKLSAEEEAEIRQSLLSEI